MEAMPKWKDEAMPKWKDIEAELLRDERWIVPLLYMSEVGYANGVVVVRYPYNLFRERLRRPHSRVALETILRRHLGSETRLVILG